MIMSSLVKRKLCLPLALIFCCLLTLPNLSALAERDITEEEEMEYVVRDLTVEDIPNDDGSGLMISWIPLDIDKRVIEYRIYRGASPDTLFFVGNISVNINKII